ncbi:hypothetical protein LOAG_12545 [Loa loa]|uniref:Uncharacterized protein n=1 Tax=Loa loa TaxID=7209 RepID=A0A1S0TL31_LOALO|nr:hypothetical protein LOAG_12545 [Loa loa]EFO15963.1 hypothetical protein LOAG_12545 [Loa loa]
MSCNPVCSPVTKSSEFYRTLLLKTMVMNSTVATLPNQSKFFKKNVALQDAHLSYSDLKNNTIRDELTDQKMKKLMVHITHAHTNTDMKLKYWVEILGRTQL